MPMAGRYLDHNVSGRIRDSLRAFGHLVVTTREVRLERAADGAQLLTAAQRGLTFVTHDRDDFILLHDAWRRWAHAWGVTERHAGILIMAQDPVVTVRQIADAIDEFMRSGTTVANEHYLWTPAGNWWRWV